MDSFTIKIEAGKLIIVCEDTRSAEYLYSLIRNSPGSTAKALTKVLEDKLEELDS